MAGILAVLTYVAAAMRRLNKSIRWFRNLPTEHEFLMRQVKENTDSIKRILQMLGEGNHDMG